MKLITKLKTALSTENRWRAVIAWEKSQAFPVLAFFAFVGCIVAAWYGVIA